MSEAVNRLQLPAQYVADRNQIFPSEAAFDWFVRKNRTQLVEARALVRPTGRWLVQPDAFDQAVLMIGATRAAASR